MADHATESYVSTAIDTAKQDISALIPDITHKAEQEDM